MQLRELLLLSIVREDTTFAIIGHDGRQRVRGEWYTDRVQNYVSYTVRDFAYFRNTNIMLVYLEEGVFGKWI